VEQVRSHLFHHGFVERSQSRIGLDGVEAGVVIGDLSLLVDDDPQRHSRADQRRHKPIRGILSRTTVPAIFASLQPHLCSGG
jgi:hypothetical protein